jgi:pantoate--beta-alanine ligase
MSSRNRLLSPDARLVAPGIQHLLKAVRRSAAAGETSAPRLRAFLLKGLRSLPGSSVDYAEIVHGETLREVVSIAGIPARALVAVRFGPVRLIDNIGLGAKR